MLPGRAARPREPPVKHALSPALPMPSGKALPFGPDRPWLAPLAGYSDLPFRLLCREYGAAACVTEMVSAKGLIYGSPGTADLLSTAPGDSPLVVQLFGAEAGFLGMATERLAACGFAWFDLNAGCSVRKVLRQGAGCALLGDAANLLALVRAMVAAAGRGHVGVKLRLGLDEGHPVLPDLALRLEDAGAGWLTLHPRTAAQGFGGRADWEAIARLAPRLSIPLLASGDLFTAGDGVRCLRETGAAGLMYARGAMRDPAIFAEHRALLAGRQPGPAAPTALKALIRRHLALARQYSPGQAALWKMRSVIPRYVRNLPGARALRQELCRCTDWQTLETLLDTLL